jgi:hypothetical protein
MTDCCHFNAVGIKAPSVSQNAPGNAGKLVGQGGCQLVLVHPFGSFCQPWPEAELLPVFWSHHDDVSGLNEQGWQIFTAALRYTPEDSVSTGAILTGYEPQPGSEVTPAFKSFPGADGCHHCGLNNRADTGNTHQPLAMIFLQAHLLNLRADPPDALIQPAPVVMKVGDNATHARGYLVGPILQNGKE